MHPACPREFHARRWAPGLDRNLAKCQRPPVPCLAEGHIFTVAGVGPLSLPTSLGFPRASPHPKAAKLRKVSAGLAPAGPQLDSYQEASNDNPALRRARPGGSNDLPATTAALLVVPPRRAQRKPRAEALLPPGRARRRATVFSRFARSCSVVVPPSCSCTRQSAVLGVRVAANATTTRNQPPSCSCTRQSAVLGVRVLANAATTRKGEPPSCSCTRQSAVFTPSCSCTRQSAVFLPSLAHWPECGLPAVL